MRLRALSALFFASACTFVYSARADDASEAKRLFEEGRKALAEGNVGPACESFAEAKRLAPQACGVVQNLAMCRQQQGRYLDASNEYDALTACASHAGQPDRVRFAEEQRSALRPKLAFLTVVAGGGPKVVALFVDGNPVDLHAGGADDKPRALEPGRHRVEVEREGCAMERLEVTLQSGQTQSLVLPAVCGAAASSKSESTVSPAPPKPLQPLPPSPEPAASVRWQIPVGWSAVAVGGLAALGSIVPCGVIVIGQRDDGDKAQARSTATVCTAVGIAGAAVLATGIVIVLTAPSSRPRATSSGTYGIAPRWSGSRDVGVEAYVRF